MKNKKALITGASKGIGRAIAISLVNSGHNVIGTSRNPDEIEDKIEGVEYIQLDLLDENSIEVGSAILAQVAIDFLRDEFN